MKLVVQTKLLPSPAQAEALAATLAACNAAANWVSRVGWEEQCFANRILRGKAYRQLKEQYGLSAQPAQHVIKKVADAYKVNRTKRRSFRGDAAQPFDDRCLSWQVAAGTVSIWTIHGRIKGIRFTCGRRQQDLLASRRGESDLLIRDGCWYLLATCDVPEATMSMPTSMIGVDLGITNIATTSDGTRLSGKQMNRVRHRNRQLRSKLQRKGTKGSPLDYLAGATVTDLRGFVLVRKRCCAGTPKGAKRLLRKRRRREARFVTDINHGISKWIVAEAQRTGRGISLEALQGIRRRVRLRAPQRAALHSWSFHQLGTFIDYKARRAGVLMVFIDPAYTSQTCSACGHVDRRSRINQSTFKCRRCGFAEHADVNAAVNLSVSGWAVVNQPDADMPLAASEAV